MRKGILTSTAAGNEGPNPATLTGFAPWLLSVAASSINRKFLTKVRLGNNKIFEVYVVYMGDMAKEEVSTSPLHLSMLEKVISRECDINSLDKKLVKGKIVYCESDTKGQGPLLAGATGFLGKGRLFGGTSSNLPLPGSLLSYNEASEVYKYIKANSKPIATISRSEEVADTRSPYIPNYSSRGPNPITPNILKVCS
ncbi:hypothetical protein FEM48_Zijuj03G0065000 [Ziziphus jujuba var. spinosa]|uniref:Cucumisin n=1 Tax=Ziziphus jujuba var. spinosa TaxID=714518 RepID=A0A978VNQ7_ZIZJJ|nr:hypothetical protein FEM48_Zijuj03G0065000 [Ziziphus jujuba var. spinosa]